MRYKKRYKTIEIYWYDLELELLDKYPEYDVHTVVKHQYDDGYYRVLLVLRKQDDSI